MIRQWSIFIVLLFVGKLLFAQEIPFEKSYFPNDKDGLKAALRAIKDGDYQAERGQIYSALENYLSAQKFNDRNAELNYKIGSIYLEIERYKALEYFKRTYELNPGFAPDLEYLLGLAHQYNHQFDEAIQYYSRFQQKLLPSDINERDKVAARIKECKNGLEMQKNPARAFITNIKEINSPYMEHSPVISADESVMLFTSTRQGSIGGKQNPYDLQYDEDIYITFKVQGRWTPPINLGEPINTRSEDATVGLSADGQSLLIYNGQSGNGDLQISRLNGDKWSWPEWLPGEINSKYKESSASFANNDRVLYFVSERPGGIGGKDIWKTTRDKRDKWSPPVNLGTVINTPDDEESVFIHPDGRTLFFSSKGHNTMGGFDIFRSVMQDNGQWTTPENLGYPINTADDDLAFVISASGRNGYLASNRPSGLGKHDIYLVTFLGPEKPMILSNEDNLLATFKQTIAENVMEKSVELKTIRLTVVKGIVVDAISNNPIEAEIEVVDNEKDEVIFSNKSNSKTGKFLISLPSGKNYGLAVKAEGYLFHSENFNIPPATAYQEIEKEIRLNNIKKDVVIVLRNVFFDQGKATLRVESYPELNRLAKVMKDVPTLKIEISGHTDNRGSASFNQKLSQDRAKAVVDYLLAQEISPDRLTYVGYGFSKPVTDNSTEEGRQLNRRVEFKVLSE